MVRSMIKTLAILFILGALFMSLQYARAADTSEILLGNGSKLVITLDKAHANSPWLVYIPGSGDHLNSAAKFQPLNFLSQHHDYNVLIINKVGVGLDGKVAVADTFQRGSLRQQRITDSLFVMKKLVPKDSRILLVALSEGAYIAPDIAEADPRVKALILLSGNSWSWLEEEVNYLPVEKQQALRDYLETEVVPNPVFDKFYSDWSYAYFDSYHTDKTYRMLQKLTLPILALNGAKDDILWLDGAVQNLRKLIDVEKKKNIEFHLIPGADHLLRCPDKDKLCEKEPIEHEVRTHLRNFVSRFAI